MERYINADAVKKTIDREIFRHETIDHVFQIIDDAPSIDIVRCKECKHYKLFDNAYNCGKGLDNVAVTDFCSYGERERY